MSPQSLLDFVVFNVFKNSDWTSYIQYFEKLVGKKIKENAIDLNPELSQALKWMKDADYLLIGAAAGLSASAGLDYTSEMVTSAYSCIR